MELNKNFIPADVEMKWTNHWLDHKYFNSIPDSRPAYSVVIPPPNVTGVLHMGHTLNETVQDILVRRARMTGFNACWVPGSDHASIATEAKVVHMLKEKGIDKNDLTREAFLKYAFEWKEKYGNIIYDQIKRLGCSVDWDRVSFTMDDHYYESVIQTFVDLHKKGLIYRGARMINWDVAAKTALSDEEVEFKDVQGKLYHIKYKVEGNESEFITIATQRPETIMGDTAVCFNPNDDRYKHLKGKKVIIPLINRAIPVIFDEYVDPAFGTGCLKVTPAHDINDYNLGLKHNLEVIDTLNDDGTISEAGKIFVGVDRYKARKLILEKLTEEGIFIKEEEYATRMGYSQRTGVVVEPKISTQWFLKMAELAKPALDAVVSGKIKIHPGDRFLATYKHWLENVKDWCISRQLWWGQQIPAWYDDNGNMVVAATEEEAKEIFNKQYSITNAQLKRDEDVLDTWFSSWLWPIEVFKGITKPNNEEINYYYPTATLVTGQDIIFFWVARMVMAGMEYMKEIPFKDVYFTGMVRDSQGRKMSKQLGNSPDLLKLIDDYGADAVRFGIMFSSPAGNDLMYDEKSIGQGSFFNNKMWNALKLVKMWEGNQRTDNGQQTTDDGIKTTEGFATNWFENRLAQAQQEVAQLLKDFKLSEALKVTYSLIWDDFCSWYLEWVKPEYGQPINAAVYTKTVSYFESLLELLHPFMPFVTEEIYHLISNKKAGDDICIKQIALATTFDKAILQQGEMLKQTITAIREVRNKQQLKPKETVQIFIDEVAKNNYTSFQTILAKQVNADKLTFVSIEIANAISIVNGKDKIFITSEFFKQDTSAQKEDLEKDLAHLKGFLLSVEKKLGNEKFVANAKPEVLAIERKKKADAEEKIRMIEATISQFNN
jgi:valyl-tRNA synthetase